MIKHLMFLLPLIVSNINGAEGLVAQMSELHLNNNWVNRAKTALPAITFSSEFQPEIQSILIMLDSSPADALNQIVNLFNAFEDAEPGTDGALFRAAVPKIFNQHTAISSS